MPILRVFVISCLILVVSSVFGQSTDRTGQTISIVNLRTGPGMGFDVIKVLEAQIPVVFIGRNESSTWLYAVVGSQEGWLSYTFISINGQVNELPVIQARVSPRVDAVSFHPDDEQIYSLTENAIINTSVGTSEKLDGVVPFIGETSLRIFRRGQVLGNRADVFSKVGDSITATNLFLDPIGHGKLLLGGYEYLLPVVEYFSQTPARDHISFSNTSLAARSGWTSGDLLVPARSFSGICLQGESPLVCEYRSVRPSVALIMIGTNDVTWMKTAEFEANLNIIVQISVDMGVIPLISTIPDQPNARSSGRVHEFNQVIREVARRFDIPLWDYWESLQGLPHYGLGEDNIHPSYNYTMNETAIFTPEQLIYGYNMRNLTALMMLDVVWRSVIDPST